jgi:hypothetical protein
MGRRVAAFSFSIGGTAQMTKAQELETLTKAIAALFRLGVGTGRF